MENYLYINTAISLIVLILIKYGKGTSNANYYLSSLAIISWCMPYPYIAELIPKDILVEPVVIAFSQMNSASIVNDVNNFYVDIELWLKSSLWALMSIGVLLLINRVTRFIKWNNQIKNDSSLTLLTDLSSKYQLPIYSINKVSSGLLLGIFNPVIIISNLITNPQHIKLIIAHEKQHLVSKDNLRLILLEIIECLFWWNPLVRKLVNTNRFFIEARCDQSTSKEYGRSDYIEGLASLVLLKHHDKASNLVCTATSTNQNNITRIKLLKEERKMTFRKKLTYILIALTTITTMSWNTLATATNSEKNQRIKANQNELGALVDFDVIITNNLKGTLEDTYHYKVTFWVNFDEKATFKISEGFNVNFQALDFTVNFKAKDLGESVFLQYELVESTQTSEEIVSEPKLTVGYGQKATIEIDNPDISQYAYLIKSTPLKAKNPSLSN
jgi:beta-lactamase regulating signal transducer with metallopeptidase domain